MIVQGDIVTALPQQNSSSLAPMDPLVAMIERAARDPSIDLERMERLLQMQERAQVRQAATSYAEALAAMQGELPVIKERGSIKIGTDATKWQKYALWEDINEQIKPVLSKHGFFLSFRTGREDNVIIVTAVLTHKGGHSESTTMHLPIDATVGKNAVQAVGSSTSYGKRYTASALLNLTSRGEDNDGNGASVAACATAQQVQEIEKLLGNNMDKIVALMKFLGVESLADMTVATYERAKRSIEAKQKMAAQKGEKS
jgi:hypothetical protein